MKKSELRQIIKEEISLTENVLDKFFKKLGVNVSPDGKITPTSKFGRILCKMAEKDNLFDKIDNNTFRLKE